MEDIFEHMTREGSTITKAEALAVFEAIIRAIVTLVAAGYSVVTPLVNISSTVRGVFEDEEDDYDPDRHQVRLSTRPGIRLRDATERIIPEKITARQPRPDLVHYHDNISETQDEQITPEGGGRITGSQLKFDEDDPEQGVFFINLDTGEATRVHYNMMRNKPKELIFMVPSLPAGNYRLEVRSILSRGLPLSSGSLSATLTVS